MPAHEQVKHLKPIQFGRVFGVHPATSERMVAVVQQARTDQLSGRRSKLSIPDQILLILEYLRE